MGFGKYIRNIREKLAAGDSNYSLRQVAKRVKLEPAYLSKIEREESRPPSEAAIRRIAEDLNEDADVLLLRAGKLSAEFQELIQKRPELLVYLLRLMKRAPARVIAMVRELEGDGR